MPWTDESGGVGAAGVARDEASAARLALTPTARSKRRPERTEEDAREA